MAALWIISISVGVFPLCNKKLKANHMFMSVMMTFSAGLFLSVGLIHLLPDADNLFT